MALTRISTPTQSGSALANLMRAQARQVEAQNQVGSEKRANDFKGYGRDTEQLTALRGAKARADSYIVRGEGVADRLAAQNLSLEHVAEAAGGARQAVAEAIASGRADALMTALESQLQAAVTGLNGRHQGRHLFAGASLDTAPVTIDSLAELAAAPTVAGVFANDARKASARLDEATTLETGFLANEVGQPLFEALRRIKQFADGPGGPLTGALTPAQAAFLQGELAGLQAAQEHVNGVVAENGGRQAQVDAALGSQRALSDQTEILLEGKTGVDMAEAITRLQLAQTAVQASAQVIATLRQSSLLELLR